MYIFDLVSGGRDENMRHDSVGNTLVVDNASRQGNWVLTKGMDTNGHLSHTVCPPNKPMPKEIST